MKKTPLFVLIVCIVCYSCHKTDYTFTPVNAGLKATFNYQPGTYWIYKDSISGEIDSFFVRLEKDDSIYAFNNGNNQPATSGAEQIIINISEYNISQPAIIDSQGWSLQLYNNVISLQYDSLDLITLVIYPFTIAANPYNPYANYNNGSFSSFNDTFILVNLYNSFFLNGQSYNNVIEVSHNGGIYDAYSSTNQNGTFVSSYNDQFFICQSAGMIKIRLNHPQLSLYRVWELQTCNIKI